MRRLAMAMTAGIIAPMISYSAAEAATTTRSCSAGGFTGSIRVTHDADERRVTNIAYKINKGSNRGGNSANITVRDEALLPARVSTLGSGIQDNTWRTFSSADYSRGGGSLSASFTFDKSNAPDPTCRILNIL